MVIPQGYGKCKNDNDRHQSNYPRVFTRDLTTGDGAYAETQPHIFEKLPRPCRSIRQEYGGSPAMNNAELRAIMLKDAWHRGRDADRYAFMQDNVEDYAKDLTRNHMTY